MLEILALKGRSLSCRSPLPASGTGAGGCGGCGVRVPDLGDAGVVVNDDNPGDGDVIDGTVMMKLHWDGDGRPGMW